MYGRLIFNRLMCERLRFNGLMYERLKCYRYSAMEGSGVVGVAVGWVGLTTWE